MKIQILKNDKFCTLKIVNIVIFRTYPDLSIDILSKLSIRICVISDKLREDKVFKAFPLCKLLCWLESYWNII